MATRVTDLPIAVFKGERTDYPFPQLSPEYLTEVTNAILYRGKIIRIPGYSAFGTAAVTSPVERIFPFQEFSGGINSTLGLVKAMDSKLYIYNSATPGFQDATHKDSSGVITSYGGDKDKIWSGCAFVGASNLQLFYCANYAYTPQVWNGTTADNSGSPVAITTIAVDSNANPSTITGFYEVKVTKSAHGLSNGQVIEVSGVTVSAGTAPNGTYQIYVVDANNFKYQVATAPLTGVGTFTANGNYWISNRFGNAIVPTNGFKARTVRSYQNHLVYFNVYDGTLDQPFTWWRSDVGQPWSWNPITGIGQGTFYEIQTTTDCGFEADPTGGDKIVTTELFGTYLAIYKDRSILLSYYSGQASLYWQTQNQVNNLGAYSSGSVINFGSYHYFWAVNEHGVFDSIRIFDGTSTPTEIESSKGVRDKLRRLLNMTYPELVSGTYLSDRDQVVWLFPSTTSTTYPDMVLIWNKSDDTWSFGKLNYTDGSSNVHMIQSISEFEQVVSTTINGLDTLGTTHTGLAFTESDISGAGGLYHQVEISVADGASGYSLGQWIQVVNHPRHYGNGTFQLSSVDGSGYSYISQFLTTDVVGAPGTLDTKTITSTIDTTNPAPLGSSYWQGKRRLVLLGDNRGQVFSWDNSTTFDSTNTQSPITMEVARQDFYIDGNDRKNLELVIIVEISVEDISTSCNLNFQLGSRKGLVDATINWSQIYPISVVPGKTLYYVYCNLVQTPNIGKLFSWNIVTSDTNQVPPIEQVSLSYVKRARY